MDDARSVRRAGSRFSLARPDFKPENPKVRRQMHYRNGREAKNGDLIVQLGFDGEKGGGKIVTFGVLHSAIPGNDYCNGMIAPVQPVASFACLVDCLHTEDLAEILKREGLDKRPEGK